MILRISLLICRCRFDEINQMLSSIDVADPNVDIVLRITYKFREKLPGWYLLRNKISDKLPD